MQSILWDSTTLEMLRNSYLGIDVIDCTILIKLSPNAFWFESVSAVLDLRNGIIICSLPNGSKQWMKKYN